MKDEPGRDEPGRDKGLDDAWARIVADYDREPDPAGSAPRWPVQEDLGPDRAPGQVADGGTDGDGSTRGDWVPPHPPPLPRPTGVTGAAWVALLGGPLLLLAATIGGWRLPTLLTAGCVIGFVGGLVFLILQMDDRRREGWDDGAQV